MKIAPFFFILLFPVWLFAQEEPLSPAILFQSEKVLKMTLKTDFRTLFKDIGDERESHPAVVVWGDSNEKKISLEVKVKVRGNFRRSRSVCNFPPLRINFKKKSTKGTPFDGQDKIKLVTHCQNNRESYEQALLDEYLIYKMYNLLTPQSFQVRLAQISYIDTKGKYDPITRHGFFIEDANQLAIRNQGRLIKEAHVHPESTQKDKVDVLSVFQFMVGNTDWSIPYQHNICMIDYKTKQPIPVPYDFDWSGFISPPYAKPDPSLEISSVRERLYRGFCRTREEFEVTFTVFRQYKDSIIGLVKNQESLTPKNKESAIKYLKSFFEIMDEPRSVKRMFLDRCRED